LFEIAQAIIAVSDAELGGGNADWLSSNAMRMSALIASAMPPPKQNPLMQAMVGLGYSARMLRGSPARRAYSSSAAALFRSSQTD